MTVWRSRPRWVTLAAVALVVLWCARPSVSAAFKNVQVGQTPPAFTLKDLAGKDWKSAEIYAKGATAVIFWSPAPPKVAASSETSTQDRPSRETHTAASASSESAASEYHSR